MDEDPELFANIDRTMHADHLALMPKGKGKKGGKKKKGPEQLKKEAELREKLREK